MMKAYAGERKWNNDKRRSRENNEDDWVPADEEMPSKRRRSRSGSSSASSSEEEDNRNGIVRLPPPPSQLPLPPPSQLPLPRVTDAGCHQEVCDHSALAKEVVRTVMGDPKNRQKFPGNMKFSKLSGKDHGLRAYFCPCMRYSNVQSEPIAFFPCLN